MNKDERRRVEMFLRAYGSLSAKRLWVFEGLVSSGDATERQLGAILQATEERDLELQQSRHRLDEGSIKAFAILALIWLLSGFIVGAAITGLALGFMPDIDSWVFLPMSVGPYVLLWLLIALLLRIFHRRRCADIRERYLEQISFATASTTEKLRIIDEWAVKKREEDA